MENDAWYKEKWATDLMGTIARSIFAKPVEAPVVSPQQAAPAPIAGAPPSDWLKENQTLVIVGVCLLALLLLFFFLRK